MAGLLTLVSFLILGTLVQAQLNLPVPASITGMVLLLIFLLLYRRIPNSLTQITRVLSPLLPLFIIPISVGIVTQKQLLSEHGVALLIILAVSLIPGALVCAWIMTTKKGES
ncbi:MAG: CidA/LrgA family protein [Oleibacter sp.]|nr:CidA/LrgA family protein [Thalassolituus sp.]